MEYFLKSRKHSYLKNFILKILILWIQFAVCSSLMLFLKECWQIYGKYFQYFIQQIIEIKNPKNQ